MSNSREVPAAQDLQLLDVLEVAERLSVSPRFIRRLVNERRIPYCKLGKLLASREVVEVVEMVHV